MARRKQQRPTEADWHAARQPLEALRLIKHVHGYLWPRHERRLRLYACACCRRIWGRLHAIGRSAVESAEWYADGELSTEAAEAMEEAVRETILATRSEPLRSARRAACHAIGPYPIPPRLHLLGADVEAAAAVAGGRMEAGGWRHPAKWEKERAAQVALLRDIFGNPFRPVAFDPDWRTPAAVALARGMYEARDFCHMPILADALDDAGCADPDVIAHCRGPGPHVRGCWVVDLVLGKD